MKIFILDDDKNVIRILQKIIKDKELGEVVGVARDGKDGLEEIKATMPDIVLIDLLMPEIDGLTVVKELKKRISKYRIYNDIPSFLKEYGRTSL